MRIVDTKVIGDKLYELCLKACLNVTDECVVALKKAKEIEENENSSFALDICLKNFEVAKSDALPVCQDTGLATVFLEIGQEIFLEGELLEDVINSAVRNAYKDGYFRKSVCDAITRKNTTDNTPAFIHTDIVAGDKIKLSFMPKGFGSENMSKLYMLTPSKGIEGIISSIVETVKVAGSNPCPPVYVGVGIGGTFDKCAYLAKKALLRPVGTLSERDDVKEIEIEALKRINALNIGAQGYGGKTTAIGVSVETLPTHIAGLPLAVNIQCHCVRCQSTII